MSDWVVRPALPSDEACCASMWLKGYARSQDISRDMALHHADEAGHADELAYWRIHQPIVTALLRTAPVSVACDPERAHDGEQGPAIIWAWACAEAERIHWVGVKRSAVAAGIAEDLVRDLLGDRLEKPMTTTFDLVDVWRLKLVPRAWSRDRGWLSTLRALSRRMLGQDLAFAAVASHVLDQQRKAWEPRPAPEAA